MMFYSNDRKVKQNLVPGKQEYVIYLFSLVYFACSVFVGVVVASFLYKEHGKVWNFGLVRCLSTVDRA